MEIGDTYLRYMSPISRAKPGSEASRLAGPASDRRKEYPEQGEPSSKGAVRCEALTSVVK
jgi:hypothetical protein